MPYSTPPECMFPTSFPQHIYLNKHLYIFIDSITIAPANYCQDMSHFYPFQCWWIRVHRQVFVRNWPCCLAGRDLGVELLDLNAFWFSTSANRRWDFPLLHPCQDSIWSVVFISEIIIRVWLYPVTVVTFISWMNKWWDCRVSVFSVKYLCKSSVHSWVNYVVFF